LKIRVSESFGNNARIYNEETEISAPIFDFWNIRHPVGITNEKFSFGK
jgi:hypothetical protein